MPKGKLPPSIRSELDARFWKSVRAGQYDEIEIVTPQFTRPANGLPPATPPRTREEFDRLRDLPADDLRAIGLRQWDEPEDDDYVGLWLLPGEWYDAIPPGYLLVCISGTREAFERGVTDDDIRFGCLAYGIIPSWVKPKYTPTEEA